MQPKSFLDKDRNPLRLKNVKTVFFDLDGTLIDVDMSRFVQGYLQRLSEEMSRLASPERVIQTIHNAVVAMFANEDAGLTLEDVLIEALLSELSIDPQDYTASLKRFCERRLSELQHLVSGHAVSADLVDLALARGWQPVLATNPIFPRQVVDARVKWGGLNGAKFAHVAAYETAHFCKPNPAFFVELLDGLGLDAGECLMVGNDPLHDLAAGQVGIRTCLLTPWKIKRAGVPFQPDWQGTHLELLTLMQES